MLYSMPAISIFHSAGLKYFYFTLPPPTYAQILISIYIHNLIYLLFIVGTCTGSYTHVPITLYI